MTGTTKLQNRLASGFTIVEVLIALTASLLLMMGLTRAYKLIGDRITESQSNLELSSTLRDVTFRLRDELRRATSDLAPPGRTSNGDGYLVYYEGPLSDSTTVLGDAPPAPPVVPEAIPDYFPTSRYGDLDDYLAFTASAVEGSPYVGFIPSGVLQAQRFASIQLDSTLSSAQKTALLAALFATYTNADAVSLVPFYSTHAEIAYWLSPRWSRTPTGDIEYDPGSGHPLYPDLDGDQLPDRLDLHRRVLLIRPDLNMKLSEMFTANGAGAPSPVPFDWYTPQLPFLVATGTGPRIVPLTTLTANQPFFDGSTNLVAPGVWSNNMNNFAPHWLTGLARMQQVMDLSISRVSDNWSPPRDPSVAATANSTYGMPSAIVQANSLAGLARPENRFAHVRMPELLVSGAGNASTMPQIALSPPHPYLTLRPNLFPNQADHTIGASGPGTLPQFFYGRFTMIGFLRPEFNLSDTVSDIAAGGASTVGVNRGGSDVVASDVLGFNIQAFDPSAPKFVWVGPDGASGNPVNDDGDSNNLFDYDELGLPDTDDELVTLDSLRSLEVLLDADGLTRGGSAPYPNPQAPVEPNLFHLVDRGSFVDLNYTRQAGGAMRGLIHGSTPPTKRIRELAGAISGLELFPPPPSNPTDYNFPNSWERSGRFVISRGGGTNTVSSFYQPVFDTWTDNYGKDEFDQEGASMPVSATLPFGALPATYRERFAGSPAVGRSVQYRQWSNQAGASTDPGFAGQDAGNTIGALTGSSTPIVSTPPIQEKLRALKVTIRVFDQSAGQIRQQTLIEDF